MADIFFDIALIMILATAFGYIARFFRQPLIPAYILTGILIGPSVLGIGLITDQETITTLSEVGIAFLLFVVGMELDFKRLRDIGMVASVGGTLQIVLMFTAGFIAASLLGIFSSMESIYIGVIFAFSSTMVVVKILADKKELNTLHGRIVIGILLMQDIFAILALSMFTALGDLSAYFILLSLAKAVLIFFGTIFLSRVAFPKIFKFSAHSHELLLLTSIAVCFLFSIGMHYLGFSIAIGGFLAGVSLAHLPYNLEMISKMRSLKDFFAVIFFVSLGMEMSFAYINGLIVPVILFVLIITFLKPIVIMFITSIFGYSKKTSFLSGTYLAQISEFSLILVAQGFVLGHISEKILTISVTIAVMTIVLSTYFMKYSQSIYPAFSSRLNIFEYISRKRNKELSKETSCRECKAILIGYSILGYSIVKKFKEMKIPFMVIDYNPDLIRRLQKEGINCIYGDIGDTEMMEKLDFKGIDIIISTVQHYKDNLMLIQKVKKYNSKAQIFVTSDSVSHALKLYDEGADYVILPHFLGGDHVSLMLEELTPDINKIIANKLKHIEELNKRRELGHEHPLHHKPKQEG
jgi:Kef-type K+ transport system membrane component KefB/Trk K+ transport system NAD-binding subunit